jgi:RNA polymerase-binding transcription factor DksA
MATKKKAAKPVKKPAPAKKTAKPAKSPGKVVAKKPAKAVAKKPTPAPKKAAPAKKIVAKPAAAPVKPIAKPVPQAAAKTATAKPGIAAPAAKKPVATPPAPVAPVTNVAGPTGEIKKIGAKKHDAVLPPPKKPLPPPKPTKVVMPEIKTKTVRKYEPEFTKSVLDQPENFQTGPTMRYSDAELVEFRELILKKLEQAKKELTYLQGLITRKDEMGGDENENRYMTMEDGSMSMEREQLAQMASRQINYIDHLEKAMMRIENKTYGICRVTGKLIDKARLRAVPHATLSIEAKQMMNK